MLAQFRTLRFRLTMLYVVIFGVLQVLLWFAIDFTRTTYLYRNFDADLLDRARGMQRALGKIEGDLAAPDKRAELEVALRSVRATDLLFEIRLPDNTVLAHSERLGNRRLPVVKPAQPLSMRVPLSADGAPTEARVLALTDDAGRCTLVVATSLAPLNTVISALRSTLVLFVSVSLLVAALTSWFMARRSLAPIAAIARQARKLGVNRLEERLPVPKAADEVAEMVTVINDMLARLEAEFRNQQRFISDVSHELRTPLAVLLGEVQAMKRRADLSAESGEFVKTVDEEARRLLRITESFLILTRVRAGARARIAEHVSIEEVILAAVQKLQPYARTRGVPILPSFDSTEHVTEPVVAGDPELLRAMVANLVENAVRHSRSGDAVDVRVRAERELVLIQVRDYGPAIAAQDIPRTFDLFRQTRSPAEPTSDVGVALPIAKGVAELHNGSIAVRNCPERGVEFTVTLPLATST
jgi:signal transduction histidine kinase